MPGDWGFEEIEALLTQRGFGKVELREKAPWRGATARTFSAEMGVTCDFRVLSVDGADYEVARLGSNRTQSEARTLPMEWRQNFGVKQSQRTRKESALNSARKEAGGAPIIPETSQAAPKEAEEPGPAASDEAMVEKDAERTDDGKSGGRTADDAEKRHYQAVVGDSKGGCCWRQARGHRFGCRSRWWPSVVFSEHSWWKDSCC